MEEYYKGMDISILNICKVMSGYFTITVLAIEPKIPIKFTKILFESGTVTGRTTSYGKTLLGSPC